MTGWLFAFLLQSTLWLGAAALLVRLRSTMGAAAREATWYVAIGASLTVPTLQRLVPGALGPFLELDLSGLAPTQAMVGSGGGASASAGASLPVETGLVVLWLAVATLLMLHHAGRLVHYRRQLMRDPIPATSHEVAQLQRLAASAGMKRIPRLTESDDLRSPIAMGVGSATEICVPTRARHELDPEQFEAMLAHELAHHERRDPLRLGLLNGLVLTFFFQPFLRLARRDVYWAAEEQCDERAADQLGDPIALASCLTEVARWLIPTARGVPVPSLMDGPSQLVRRVNGLMVVRTDRAAPRRRGPRFVGVLILATAPWLTPSVTIEAAPSPQAATASTDSRPTQLPREHDDGEHGDERSGPGEHGQPEHGDTDEHEPSSLSSDEEHSMQRQGAAEDRDRDPGEAGRLPNGEGR